MFNRRSSKTFLRFSIEQALWFLDEGTATGSDARDNRQQAMDLLAEIIGFDPLQNSIEYLGGIHLAALQGTPQPWGNSMLDAFSPFEAGVRYRSENKVKVVLGYGEAKYDSNAVTFGSPNSNALARAIYNIDVDAQDRFVPMTDGIPSGVTFEHPSDAVIKRRAGYTESHRALRLADGRLFAPVHKDGVLQDDYLLISCVQHPRDRLGEARKQDVEIRRMDILADCGRLDEAGYARLELLRRRREQIKIHNALCISGLYGPATGAAKLLFEDRDRLQTLKDAVAGMKSFHAIYHVPRIENRTVDGIDRDFPADLSLRPVAIMPADE